MANLFTLPKAAPHGPAIATDLLIGGEWRDAKARFDLFNPSTGERLTTIADGDVGDAMAAIAAAEQAAPGWAATSPRARAEILRKSFDLMIANAEWLAWLMSLENGKSLPDARAEVIYAAEYLRWYAEGAAHIPGELSTAPSGQNRIVVEYQPIGISLLITPWNFPAAMATRKIGPALAAGCTCILKPAPETPLTAFAFVQLMMDAGVPPGVINVVPTTRAAETVKAMLHDPRVRKLSFTGSTEVGRLLLREAADQVISCAMELGGNAPFLVFDDANLSDALDGAMAAKMRNGGEACTAANRFYVQRSLYKSFTNGIVERMSKVKLGEGTDPQTVLGAMITEKAVTRMAALVDDAVAKGGKLLLGGQRLNRPGYYYPPTVIADVPDNADILRKEIFGPVVTLQTFDSDAQAIAKANDTEHGLAAYVFTSDLKRGMQVCEKIEAGMVALNRGFLSDPAAPFGGVKQSGLGREGSHQGLMEYCEAKYIAVNW